PGHADVVRRTLEICRDNDLFAHGIVETSELAESPHPELAYEMVLEHERIPFVTYPHEWSAGMLKEAALFHIRLYELLENYGLTIKDWHPHNILFAGTRPVFVDFTSIIPIAGLAGQFHLRAARPATGAKALLDETSRAIYEMYRLMFEPYFGLPLAMMHRGLHAEARRRMYETTLNATTSIITRDEAFAGAFAQRVGYEAERRWLLVALFQKGPRKPRFFRRLRRIVSSRRAALERSDYSSYYEDKNEAFSATPGAEWTNKQRGVHGALTRFKPRTVLDLGSNTGWFSKLAAMLGSSVVAVDLDEASIDRLYAEASAAGLDILPLVANLTSPLPPLFPKVFEDEPSLSLIGDGGPLVSNPAERLRCEMVLALAIVHHLSLGQGLTFDAIAALLGDLATKYLCVEFVEMDDAMIRTDPDFFPALKANPASFSNYSRDNFIAGLSRHFTNIEVVPSYPETRSLLVCSR
ncbi:MAG: class I SAM-dependent methyltransferase, partial [Thermoanaerobaculia bacterium]